MNEDGKARLEGRAGAWFGIALTTAVAVVALLAPRPAAVEREMPEYIPMVVTMPDSTLKQLGTHPDMRVMGIEKVQSSDVLCSEERIARMDEFVEGHGLGEIFVDRASWETTPDGTRAGIASFFSKCRHEGGAVNVLDGAGGELLAVYTPGAGLENRGR